MEGYDDPSSRRVEYSGIRSRGDRGSSTALPKSSRHLVKRASEEEGDGVGGRGVVLLLLVALGTLMRAGTSVQE